MEIAAKQQDTKESKEDSEEDDFAARVSKLMGNPYEHDDKTIIALMIGGDSESRQAIFSSADVLGITGKHKIEVLYYGPPQDPMLEMCRSSYSFLRKVAPDRYEYSIKYQSRVSSAGGMFNSGKRPAILAYLREKRPKFVVIGLREGMNPELLDNSRDISFRQLIGATPIICKKRFLFKKHGKGADSFKNPKYDPLVYAFHVDWSENAFFAFKLMVDHFQSGDTIHLIWVRPDASPTGGGDTASLNVIFQRYHEVLKGIEAEVVVQTHISGEPNVGQFLVSFANNKRNAVDFLVVYCDLMGVYAKGQDLIGSVADWAVRYCQCPVVVPKLPAF